MFRPWMRISRSKWLIFLCLWTTTTPPKESSKTLANITDRYRLRHSHLGVSNNSLTTYHLLHLSSRLPLVPDNWNRTWVDVKLYSNNVRKSKNCLSSWIWVDTTHRASILRRLPTIHETCKMQLTELLIIINWWYITKLINTVM